jgi:hypothetical protein
MSSEAIISTEEVGLAPKTRRAPGSLTPRRGELSATAKSRVDDDAMQNFVTRLANDRR